MSTKPKIVLSHNGVCISDLERSIRFYSEALGFEVRQRYEIAAPYDKLAELPGLMVRVAFMTLEGRVLELMEYKQPKAVGTRERRAMNRLGLTHLCFAASDIDATAERIAKAGGQVLRETRVETPISIAIFCTDPDGVRIELTQRPA
jgi:lactoylglutathione lyase